jgi:FAD binding domain
MVNGGRLSPPLNLPRSGRVTEHRPEYGGEEYDITVRQGPHDIVVRLESCQVRALAYDTAARPYKVDRQLRDRRQIGPRIWHRNGPYQEDRFLATLGAMTAPAQFPTTTVRPSPFDRHVLTPGTREYDSARSVWNAMVDHRPKLIVQCASVGDVVTAVRTARERDLEIGVRCGGHNIAGLAVPDGELMIDLTRLGRVTVDAAARRAWVQGGAMLGTLDRATQPFALATTAGNVSHTGVGGLTLGGGMGWLARQHGLACDNVVSCTVVTADGAILRASADEHPDLFWGLRGGGG